MVDGAEFSPDSLRVITASWDGTARLWDIKTGTALTYLRAVQTVENVMFNCVPSLSTAARIAIEMVLATRAYSIAVAPDFIQDEFA